MRAAIGIGCVLAMAVVDSASVRSSRERAAGLVAPAEIGSVRRTVVESAPGASMRPVMTSRYKMSGRVRPLLFWIGKDDIGIARIVWRRGNGAAVGYELLVGTDPAKAPRSLNRWGYIAEDIEGADGSILALMTGADEATYNEAASNSGRPPGAGDFRAIQAHVERGAATWQTARVSTPSALTVHDVDAALERIRRETAAAPSRGMPLPSGARPGFLTAVAELIDLAVTGVNRKADTRELLRPRVQYVFGQGAYEIYLREVESLHADHDGRLIPAVRTAFEIRTIATDARTRFEITSGSDGDLLGVPVAISWQPRWWLRVALSLESK
jgi:hypothetical protein